MEDDDKHGTWVEGMGRDGSNCGCGGTSCRTPLGAADKTPRDAECEIREKLVVEVVLEEPAQVEAEVDVC